MLPKAAAALGPPARASTASAASSAVAVLLAVLFLVAATTPAAADTSIADDAMRSKFFEDMDLNDGWFPNYQSAIMAAAQKRREESGAPPDDRGSTPPLSKYVNLSRESLGVRAHSNSLVAVSRTQGQPVCWQWVGVCTCHPNIRHHTTHQCNLSIHPKTTSSIRPQPTRSQPSKPAISLLQSLIK
jgi:hypothetical protein